MDRINLGKYVINKTDKNKEDIELLQAIHDAIKEIEAARSLFNNVQDSKLIDIAIFSEDVAKKKYDYLISLAKQKGLRVSKDYILDNCMKCV